MNNIKITTTQKSKELFQEALKLIPGGAVCRSQSIDEGYKEYPIYIEKAEGSRLYDVDGNEYIDYLQAHGPTLVGNANPKIINFVEKEMKKGTTYGLPHELTIKVAEKLIKHVPCFEKVSFLSSGSEAAQMAMRLARAYTGRDLILKFEGHYHGWINDVAVSLKPSLEEAGTRMYPNKIPAGIGIPKSAYQDIIVIPWNDLMILEKTIKKYKDKIAGIICDTCMGNCACILPEKGYLEALRELTKKYGIILIFDEVITGFRLALGGAQEVFKITPDIAVLGKAFGGGFPVSAYGGKKEIMDLITKDKVLRAGTLNANRVVMAAAYATIEFLEQGNGRIYKEVYQKGDRLRSGIRKIIDEQGIKALIQGIGPMFQIVFTNVKKIRDYRELCMYAKKDIYLHYSYL